MRTKQFFLSLTALVLAFVLIGCGIENLPMPRVPDTELAPSALTAQVDYINGRTCRIIVTEGDSHFDQGDELQLTFTNLTGSKKSLRIGDIVRFEYDYISQVSELLGSPHITVNQIQVD